MRKLSKEDIRLNNVNTIKEFKILNYLKKELDINCFDIYLMGNDTIKVCDEVDSLIFKLEDNKVTYEDDFEIRL